MSDLVNDQILEDIHHGFQMLISDYHVLKDEVAKNDNINLLKVKDIQFLNDIEKAIKEYQK